MKIYEPKMTLKDIVAELAIILAITSIGYTDVIKGYLDEMNKWGKPEEKTPHTALQEEMKKIMEEATAETQLGQEQFDSYLNKSLNLLRLSQEQAVRKAVELYDIGADTESNYQQIMESLTPQSKEEV